MTPTQKIKREILLQLIDCYKTFDGDLSAIEAEALELLEPGITAETVDVQYLRLDDEGLLQDNVSEFRGGETTTEIPCEYSRNYESKSVAAKMSDGSWVGWTYYFGGGKHGQPEEMEWMEDAYEVEMTEVMEVVRKFKKKEAAP